MQEKINQLTMGEKIIVAAGVVLLIASFLPWYSVDLGIVDFTRNGWESPGAIWSILATLVGVVMAGSIIAFRFGNMQAPNLGSVSLGQAYLGGGVLTVILVLLKLINESSEMAFGFFLGIICAVALAAGGYLLYTEEKATVR